MVKRQLGQLGQDLVQDVERQGEQHVVLSGGGVCGSGGETWARRGGNGEEGVGKRGAFLTSACSLSNTTPYNLLHVIKYSVANLYRVYRLVSLRHELLRCLCTSQIKHQLHLRGRKHFFSHLRVLGDNSTVLHFTL